MKRKTEVFLLQPGGVRDLDKLPRRDAIHRVFTKRRMSRPVKIQRSDFSRPVKIQRSDIFTEEKSEGFLILGRYLQASPVP